MTNKDYMLNQIPEKYHEVVLDTFSKLQNSIGVLILNSEVTENSKRIIDHHLGKWRTKWPDNIPPLEPHEEGMNYCDFLRTILEPRYAKGMIETLRILHPEMLGRTVTPRTKAATLASKAKIIAELDKHERKIAILFRDPTDEERREIRSRLAVSRAWTEA